VMRINGFLSCCGGIRCRARLAVRHNSRGANRYRSVQIAALALQGPASTTAVKTNPVDALLRTSAP
jgi:hypothetical protein